MFNLRPVQIIVFQFLESLPSWKECSVSELGGKAQRCHAGF